jgi:hypothetical protein
MYLRDHWGSESLAYQLTSLPRSERSFEAFVLRFYERLRLQFFSLRGRLQVMSKETRVPHSPCHPACLGDVVSDVVERLSLSIRTRQQISFHVDYPDNKFLFHQTIRLKTLMYLDHISRESCHSTCLSEVFPEGLSVFSVSSFFPLDRSG